MHAEIQDLRSNKWFGESTKHFSRWLTYGWPTSNYLVTEGWLKVEYEHLCCLRLQMSRSILHYEYISLSWLHVLRKHLRILSPHHMQISSVVQRRCCMLPAACCLLSACYLLAACCLLPVSCCLVHELVAIYNKNASFDLTQDVCTESQFISIYTLRVWDTWCIAKHCELINHTFASTAHRWHCLTQLTKLWSKLKQTNYVVAPSAAELMNDASIDKRASWP